MGELGFSCDSNKAKSNEDKHGVSFDEAESAFSDENGLLLDDEEHSEREPRFLLMGLSSAMRILVVSHTMPDEDTIHIIKRPRSHAKRETTVSRETG